MHGKSFPEHSQILSCSCGEISVEGLVPLLNGNGGLGFVMMATCKCPRNMRPVWQVIEQLSLPRRLPTASPDFSPQL